MSMRRCIAAAALSLPLAVGAQGLSQDIQPKPTELMPLAAKSLLLDVVDTGKRLVAVGERGHVVGSLDGKNWVQVPTPTRATLNAVYFADEQNGWAVGHDAVILRTRDGGRSWILQNFEPEEEKPFLDVYFMDAKRGLAIGAYSIMYSTIDGGDNWAPVDSPIREDEWHFNSITRLNNGKLFIVGEAGTLAISSDEGQSWESVESPYDSSLFDAAPLGADGIAIMGLRGNAFLADDAANPEWNRLDVGSENSLIGASTLADGELVMVGINGVVYRTSGGASSVTSIPNPVGITLAAVQPVDGALIAVGEAGAQFINSK